MSAVEQIDPATWRLLLAFRRDPSFDGDIERTLNGVPVQAPVTDPAVAWAAKAVETIHIEPYIRQGRPVSGYTRRLTGIDAAKYLQRLTEGWGHGLSDDERHAFQLYRKASGYEQINTALRSGDLSGSVDIGSEQFIAPGRPARVPRNLFEGVIEKADPVAAMVWIRNRDGRVHPFPWHDVEAIPTPPEIVPVSEVVNLLDGAMGRAPQTDRPLGLLLYRGIRDMFALFGPEGPQVGDRIHDKGYVSTTTEYHVAWAFSQGNITGGRLDSPHPVILQIEAPAGIHGGWINSITADSGNREFVLPRGSTFEVTDVNLTPGDEIVRLKLIPGVTGQGKAVQLTPDFLPDVTETPFDEALHPRDFHGRFARKLSADWRAAVGVTERLIENGGWIGQSKNVDEPLQHVVDHGRRGRLPEIVSSDEFDRRAAAPGSIVMYHGTNRPEYADDFLHGRFRVSLGIDGSGYYTADDPGVAGRYGSMKSKPGRLIRMALKPGASIANSAEIAAEARNLALSLRGGLDLADPRSLPPEQRPRAALAKTFVDAGRYAAWQGFDAIHIGNATGEGFNFYIVLNRDAVIVDGTLYDPEHARATGELKPWQ